MPRTRRTTNQPARLQDAQVLFKYILHLLGCKDLDRILKLNYSMPYFLKTTPYFLGFRKWFSTSFRTVLWRNNPY